MQKNYNKEAREIKRIYKDYDVKMKNVPSVCSQGCSHCCLQLIKVHAAEELPITRYLSENFTPEQFSDTQKRIEEWFDFFNASTPNRTLEDADINSFAELAADQRIPCPFLANAECSIYPVRPISCRTFTVNDNPALCAADTNRNGDMKGYELKQSAFNEIARLTGTTQIRLLQYAVEEFFKINRPKKAIASLAYSTNK